MSSMSISGFQKVSQHTIKQCVIWNEALEKDDFMFYAINEIF